ncbi:MAG: hypothetical protein ABS39_04725 [Acidovorax sp. SCN 65-28]|uniref:hypothetical protein n=1 Tax=Acidovorax sp. TaxID=1872122 RepID=UPI00086D1EEF|nr:hypothetical protein [Acidovorax sp.]MBN9625687.1 hypothetical protein [Acidovorax sp.]ODS78948.1 MAG: hypothetical protein ABS39_04725 [Acidovorax sp. SCN 65-28]OJT99939.1 MAG: hypothetical protein BGN90_09370 [Acidovorax sp. 65-7]
MSKPTKKPEAPESAPPIQRLNRKTVPCINGGTSEETALNFANLMISPEMGSFRVITNRERRELIDQLDTPALIEALRQQTQAVHKGDLRAVEAMLMNQATALQSLFVKLTETGLQADLLRQQETALRLALKAQSQCRATLETLANIKNPPVVYAKQANVTTGPQQINNAPQTAPTGVREKVFEENKLKELNHEKQQWLDAGAPSAAGGTHQGAKALATVHRAEKRRR